MAQKFDSFVSTPQLILVRLIEKERAYLAKRKYFCPGKIKIAFFFDSNKEKIKDRKKDLKFSFSFDMLLLPSWLARKLIEKNEFIKKSLCFLGLFYKFVMSKL